MHVVKEFIAKLYSKIIKVPTGTDLQHVMEANRKLGFWGDVGSLDCTHCKWSRCPHEQWGIVFSGDHMILSSSWILGLSDNRYKSHDRDKLDWSTMENVGKVHSSTLTEIHWNTHHPEPLGIAPAITTFSAYTFKGVGNCLSQNISDRFTEREELRNIAMGGYYKRETSW